MYTAAWVKSQARMASTSNQETFKAEVAGRLLLDVLRQVHLGAHGGGGGGVTLAGLQAIMVNC